MAIRCNVLIVYKGVTYLIPLAHESARLTCNIGVQTRESKFALRYIGGGCGV